MRILRSITVAILVVFCAFTDVANAAEPDEGALLAQQYLEQHPGGVLIADNEVAYPDGTGFVGVDVDVMSVSQCGSGKFCVWTSPTYMGSFSYVSGTGVTRTLARSVKSFWNNRTKAARLYNNAGTASTCYAAGVKKSSLSSGYQTPAKVYLSSGSGC